MRQLELILIVLIPTGIFLIVHLFVSVTGSAESTVGFLMLHHKGHTGLNLRVYKLAEIMASLSFLSLQKKKSFYRKASCLGAFKDNGRCQKFKDVTG